MILTEHKTTDTNELWHTKMLFFKSIILFKFSTKKTKQKKRNVGEREVGGSTETRTSPYHDEKHVVLTAMYFHSLHLQPMDFDQ